MEEEEPPPSLPPRCSPPLSGGNCPSNGNLITTVTENSTNDGPAAGNHSRPQLRPPVPANKPSMAQPRPHSVHGDVGQYNLNSCGNNRNGSIGFPNGSIITQITDQDGYRATRVPLSEASMANSRQPDNLNTDHREGTDNMRYSSSRQDVCANSNGHVNGSATLASEPNNYQKISSYVNNNIGSPSRSDELSVQMESPSRYSYPNKNTDSEGVFIRNMINKNGAGNGVVGGMIARLNGKPVSISNSNPLMLATNGGASVTFSKKQENFPGARNNNDCEEVSTEL